MIVFIIYKPSFNRLKNYTLHKTQLFFILWIAFVPLITDRDILNNITYAFYFLFVFNGVMSVKIPNHILVFLRSNVWLFQLMLFTILIFSFLIIYQNPIPSFRTYRDSIMHFNANEDALVMATCFPFLFLIKNKGIRLTSILYYIYYLTLYNSTRAGIAMSALVLILLYYEKYKNHKVIFIVIVITSIVIGGDIFRKNVLDDDLFDKGISVLRDGGDGAITSRLTEILFPLAQYTLTNSPIYGFGAKSYSEVASKSTFYDSFGPYVKRSPHNFFIVFLVSWGVIGLSLLLIIYFKYLQMSFKYYIRYKTPLSTAIFSSWVVFTGMNFVANSFSYRGWSLFVLLLFTTHLLKMKQTEHTIQNNEL